MNNPDTAVGGTYRQFSFGGHSLQVDFSEDIYGESFWNQAQNAAWELPTFGFVLLQAKNGSVFIDAGAASGIFSLLAAKRGGTVIAIEPHSTWLRCLKKNVSLNELSSKIQIIDGALGREGGETSFGEKRDARVLSSITVGGADLDAKVKVHSLVDILELAQAQKPSGIALKMDIEGAEYGILTDKQTLDALAKLNVHLFLSIHPGFPRHWGSRRMRIFLGFFDNISLFARLRSVATVSSALGKPVKGPLRFSLSSLLGHDDFLVDFSSM